MQRPAFGDFTGGMFIAGGIASALLHRERTGEAVEVDVDAAGYGMHLGRDRRMERKKMSSPDAPPPEYPPPEHILRDLQLEMETGPENYFCSRMPVVPELLTADGRVEASVLATLADLAGATVTFQFLLPDWMATADLAVHLLEAPIGTTLVARPRILRAGRRTIITEVAIEDEGGSSTRPVGHATLTFARIERPDLTLHLNPEDAPTERQRKSFGTPGGGLHTGHREQTGIRIIDAERGICILDRTDYTLNSFGTLQGGSVAALAESAA